MNMLKNHTSAPSLHHLGFVVANIAAGMDGFTRSWAASWNGLIYNDPHQKVRVAFLTIKPGDPQIELVEPATEDSPVQHFLSQRNGGLHHLCYEVASVIGLNPAIHDRVKSGHREWPKT